VSDGETRFVPPFSGLEASAPIKGYSRCWASSSVRFWLLAKRMQMNLVGEFGVVFGVRTSNPDWSCWGLLVTGASYVLHSWGFSRSTAVVIGVFASVVGSGFCGLLWELVQKRLHPISQKKIVAGRSTRMIALLRTRMFVGSLKVMPDHNLVQS
jgi:hypothetical protein